MGNIILAGGAEFGGSMSEPDLKAIEVAGGLDAPICIVPTAAAPDNNHQRAGNHGIRWFKSLGAKNVFTVDILDAKSANDEALAASILNSRLIYLLGGFPRYLAETLANSLCWQTICTAHEKGAVIAGSSAGSMVLCEYYFDPSEKKLLNGLNLIPNTCVLPHHNQYGKTWEKQIRKVLPAVTLLGIDEQTGMLNDTDGNWAVYGMGEVTVYFENQARAYKRGERFSF